ncbi:helix-turn-helix domain-containing protein [Thermoactinospora rubra]|uniref:helix-turn-helix domain-containing protein n=1 Tax=Thermoactinospora rubra TaxID=1088767 RepID=UPI001301FA42|nr:helix-turn-helix transcriptional regulator [Thermoactinospora rubra]
MLAALRGRDIGSVFCLVRQYAGMSQTHIGSVTGMSQGKVSAIMSGNQQVTAFEVVERVADGLGMPDAARMALGLAPRTALTLAIPSQDDRPAVSTRAVDLVQRGGAETNVRRREFVGLAGAALFSAALGPAEQASPDGIEDLAAALVSFPAPGDELPDLAPLARAVAAAKQSYQACRYGDVVSMLPSLLRSLRVACTVLEGDARLKAHALTAEAYHVAASILIKQEDKGLAWLAADRSVQAAHASESPLMIGSSARIITHALMDGGHHRAAVSTASTAAQRMDAELSGPTPDDLSVYGSLLLRGAVAAAQQANRHTAVELLDEAAEAGKRLGHDGNHMWTAFGPNNVLCHRVNVALTMGDAGTAVEYARKVNIDALPINERKATLLLDTARAFLTWGKHDRALYVMRAAGDIAPEEITVRPATLRLVRDLLKTAPASVRREAREYAESLGVSA